MRIVLVPNPYNKKSKAFGGNRFFISGCESAAFLILYWNHETRDIR
jgi:hypothetical protein